MTFFAKVAICIMLICLATQFFWCYRFYPFFYYSLDWWSRFIACQYWNFNCILLFSNMCQWELNIIIFFNAITLALQISKVGFTNPYLIVKPLVLIWLVNYIMINICFRTIGFFYYQVYFIFPMIFSTLFTTFILSTSFIFSIFFIFLTFFIL